MYGLELVNVQAQLGSFYLKDIDLAIPEGNILGLLGQSGAGKTALLNIIMGSYLKTSGKVLIHGLTYEKDEIEIRKTVAIVHDGFNINRLIKLKRIYKDFKDLHPSFDDLHFQSLCDEFDIPLKKRLNNISLSMIKKFFLSIALALKPSLLLLDNLFIDMDDNDKEKVMVHLKTYMDHQERTMILTSSRVKDLKDISDYIAIMDNGEIKAFNKVDKLLEDYIIVEVKQDKLVNSRVLYRRQKSSHQEWLMKKDDVIDDMNSRQASLEDLSIFLTDEEEM